jgi:predicted metal-dependent peptidase
MAKKNNKEYQEGYEAAIEALRKHLAGETQGGENSDSGGESGSSDMISPEEATGIPSNKSNGGSSSGKESSKSREGDSKKNQGVVRAEDCAGPEGLNKVPGRAGGMIDRETGDKLSKSEGYDEIKGSDSAIEKDWADEALKAIRDQKWTGEGGPGKIKTKIETIYKVSTDWKTTLRKIVGHAISPDDSRYAYTNKNVLVSQDRLARTDKDKYDHLSYMVIILDVSGSMWNEKIRMMMREAYQVALQKKPLRILTIQNDADLQEVVICNSLKEFEKYVKNIQMKGGGGNDLKPAWDFLSKGHPKFMKEFNKIKRVGPAEIVMNFTDGYLTQIKRNPRTMKNLCWAILDNPGFNLEYKDSNTKMIHLTTTGK